MGYGMEDRVVAATGEGRFICGRYAARGRATDSQKSPGRSPTGKPCRQLRNPTAYISRDGVADRLHDLYGRELFLRPGGDNQEGEIIRLLIRGRYGNGL